MGYQIELPPTHAGTRRQARRAGLATREEAAEALQHIATLLDLADDEHIAVQVADLIQKTLRERRELPATAEVRRRLLGGADPAAEAPTVQQWLTEWVATHELAESTRRAYQSHITHYFIPHLGPIRLDRLRSLHVQAVFDAIQERNDHIRACRGSEDEKARARVRGMRIASPATQQRIRATLRSALNAALARPDIPLQHNPACHLSLPSAPRPRPRVWTRARLEQWRRTGEVPPPVMLWTPEQTAAFLRAAGDQRLYALFHLLVHRGLRRGEAVGLPWAETRLEEAAIDIRTAVVELDWDMLTTVPKTPAGERTVTLDEATTVLLQRWRARQAEERLAAGPGWHDSGLVFTNPDGTGLRPSWVSDEFARIVARADLPPIRLHDLRHGAASLGLAAGVDIKVVSAELGHSTTTFTQDTYQTVFPEVAREAAEATAGLLANTATAGARPR
ncbi:tyrosine-type recombinase/integrase [Streptomonospora halophila]|uniref:Tyrosine-type recombinase/integrase n=1 Tax=Streptomonospora halophila TaxID=427369 RepID=A0ABP9GXW8_9ACTN